ncbi:MAG: serine/threonine protein kinase [Planctomycetaceae bacterium]|nr:serine/threonine protein kinase [Planctomycetaceae bacterium]
MIENRLRCNDALLQAMLCEELPTDASNDVLDHVESCQHCQQRVTELAASAADWKRMADAMSDLPEQHSDLSPSFSGLGQRPIHWTEAMARQLLSAPTHPEMLGRLGRYEIERLIGSGGMGVVFKAHDSELNRPVAIKLLAPYLASSGPARRRFSREARAAAAVVHQHVVPIHNVETERDAPFIVMQFVSGESLQDRIDRQGPLELCEILRIGMQVADGLSAAHQQGLVHRDIKPSNILLEEEVDRALISDFGLARAADDATLTRPGFHPGTPQYMSPEQAAGLSVDARSDLFSLGSTLYTMCTGRPPFRAENSLSVMRRIVDSEPVPVRDISPQIPAWLCTIVGKLMSKEKSERPQSAAELRDLLAACLSHVQQPAISPLPVVPWNSIDPFPKKIFLISKGSIDVISLISVFATFGLFLMLNPQDEQSGSKSTIVEEHEHNTVGLTWKSLLGKEPPSGYPADLPLLIQGLNNSRGEWLFAGKMLSDGNEVECEAKMQINGGFLNRVQQGKFPQWQISVAWPREKPTNTLVLNVMVLPEPETIKLMLIPQLAVEGNPVPSEHKMYGGSWDAEKSTVTWTPQSFRLPGTDNSSETASDDASKETNGAFRLVVKSDGELHLVGYQQGSFIHFSGQSVARVGEQYVEEQPALEKLPNGYKVFFAGRTEVYVVTSNGDVVIGPRVETIGCSDNMIYGKIIEYVPGHSDTPGYFWFDSTSGETSKGLELTKWRDDLKAKGIEEPRLVGPEEVGEQY